jgi:Na+-transporting NADH:ubiquinone oxidoreductase subunit C
MKTNFSNRYIFIYITVLVIIIASVLALTATLLQQRQEDNRKMEKMQSILRATGIETSDGDIMSLYQKYITEEQDDDRSVYFAQVDSGRIYVFPLKGRGLWGPVWGFIALKEDMNTVVGITLDHKGETPGLGAQIATNEFQRHFKGKKIFDNKGKFTSITLVKGGVASFSGDRSHAVDAISGGTLTSNGVAEMLFDCLRAYEPFMKGRLNYAAPVLDTADTLVKQEDAVEKKVSYYRSDTSYRSWTEQTRMSQLPRVSSDTPRKTYVKRVAAADTVSVSGKEDDVSVTSGVPGVPDASDVSGVSDASGASGTSADSVSRQGHSQEQKVEMSKKDEKDASAQSKRKRDSLKDSRREKSKRTDGE